MALNRSILIHEPWDVQLDHRNGKKNEYDGKKKRRNNFLVMKFFIHPNRKESTERIMKPCTH